MTATIVIKDANPSIVRSTSQLIVGGIGAQLLVAATFALVARELGPTVFGLMVALLGIGAVAQDLFDFGTSQWLTRESASGRLSLGAVREILRRRTAAVGTLCALGATVCVAAGAPPLRCLATGLYVVAAVANAGMYARLRGVGRFRRAAAHLAGERLSLLLVVFALIAVAPGREVSVAVLIGGMALTYAVSALCAPRQLLRVELASGPSLPHVYRRASSFGLIGLSADLQQLDAAAAAPLAGAGVAASVGVASKLTSPAGVIAGAVSQVAFRGVAAGGRDAITHARLAIRISWALAAAFALISPLLPMVAVAALGGQYHSARAAIVVYAVGTVLAMLSQPLTSILTASGRDRLVSRIVAAAVVAGLVVGSLSVRPLGAAGMGLGFVATQVAILATCSFVYAKRGTVAQLGCSGADAVSGFDL